MVWIYSQHQALQTGITHALESFKRTQLCVISGGTGTGKTWLAEVFHRQSSLGDGPLVPVTAASLTGSRFESQLFGHEKGAFTGATQTFQGLVGAASNGTLLLEGFEDLPLTTQANLLRFLQERVYRRVGGIGECRFEGQLILTARLNLRELLEEDTIREDIYFRLANNEIHLPSLLDRPSDWQKMVCDITQELSQNLPGFDIPPLETLMSVMADRKCMNLHDLRNRLQQMIILGIDGLADQAVQNFEERVHDLPDSGSLKEDLAILEKRLIARELARFKGSRSELAERLQISRRSLMYKLKDYGLGEDS